MERDVESYIRSRQGIPFSWSENNCMSFVMDYLDLCDIPAAWFKGRDTRFACGIQYARKARELGYENLAHAFDVLLVPELTLHPRDGFIVARPADALFGHLFGLHWRRADWFLTEDAGLQPVEPDLSHLYWSAR